MLDPRLNHVVASARHGSFTAAAQAVGVTQSAITKSIAELERQLGYLIFHRTSRGIMLTEEGRDFVERASRLLDDARELLREPSGREDAFAGILRIGVCPTSLESKLIEPTTRLLARHPSIRLDLSGSSFERMAQQLRNGAVDVAVGLNDAFAEHPDFQREALGPLRTVWFGRKGHPILQVADINARDIARYEVVTPSESRPYGTRIRQIYEDQGLDAQAHIHVIDYFPIVKRIVASSDALSMTSLEYVTTASFARRFAVVPVIDALPPSILCCAVRARWEPKPAVRAFIRACRESASPDPDLAGAAIAARRLAGRPRASSPAGQG
jgi:DNA-binding transcriptional LysR family regulator